ncbi:MAG: hypothetical protein BWX70_01271 [Verrucomicrobia bacterium ADurb.Bin070]|nr:MAG: hypothetical protein BWX70_01271 [Verrucomicrobia bacterium ADurb.Bin070]
MRKSAFSSSFLKSRVAASQTRPLPVVDVVQAHMSVLGGSGSQPAKAKSASNISQRQRASWACGASGAVFALRVRQNLMLLPGQSLFTTNMLASI